LLSSCSMPRTRRYIESGRVYEITLRARRGLPFPAWSLCRLLLRSALARTQRTQYVELCHFIWMGNHAHILVVVRDAESCKRFYTELQKRLTDYLKRLLQLEHLTLWEGTPGVIAILDLKAAMDRIRYFYCNPARANLVEHIQDYPGYSTWDIAAEVSPDLNARYASRVPWVRQYHIRPLKRSHLTRVEDAQVEAQLRMKPRRFHELVITPNAWLRCFGIQDSSSIAEINQRINRSVRASEEQLARKRQSDRKSVLGADRLRAESIMRDHTPAKHDRGIFVISSDRELRVNYIHKIRGICDRCAALYERFRRGAWVLWPPGVFPPAPPMAASALAG